MDVLNYLEPKFHPILISGLGDIAIFAYKRRILYLSRLRLVHFVGLLRPLTLLGLVVIVRRALLLRHL